MREIMNATLRCPACRFEVKAEWGSCTDECGGPLVLLRYPDRYIEISPPVTCEAACQPGSIQIKMMVVVKCPFCEGSGRRFERVGDTLLRPPCLTCETTGELLEGQP